MSADEPVRVKLICRLHVMDLSTETAAGSHQFMRVVTMGSANHNYHVTPLGQFDRRMLPLLGRLAHGVNEPDFRLRKFPAQQSDQVTHPLDRLGGLRGNTESRAFL